MEFDVVIFTVITKAMVWAFIACLIMMLFDMVTGVLGGFVNKEFKSSEVRKGIIHKIMMVIIIMVSFFIEIFIYVVPALGVQVPIVIPVCVFIFGMEISSIMENIVKIYPELGNTKLMKLFDCVKDGESDVKGN